MLETSMLIPSASNNHKIHSWLSDRFGCHRGEGADYLFVAETMADKTLLTVVHNTPIPRIGGGVQVSIPDIGSVVDFRVRVNATRKVAEKRVPLSDVDMQEWLSRHVEGASIESCEVVGMGWDNFGKRGKDYSFEWKDVVGKLRVESVAEFERTLCRGIGRMRSVGYGLIAIPGMKAFRILNQH